MSILALDQATITGWAFGEPGRLPVYGSFNLGKTGNDVGKFVTRFEEELHYRINIYDPDIIVYEKPILPSSTQFATLLKLYGIAAHIEVSARRHKIACEWAQMQVWRKHFMGKGTGPKTQMKAMSVAQCRRLGWIVSNDNEADALGILDYALHCHYPDKMAKFALREMMV